MIVQPFRQTSLLSDSRKCWLTLYQVNTYCVMIDNITNHSSISWCRRHKTRKMKTATLCCSVQLESSVFKSYLNDSTVHNDLHAVFTLEKDGTYGTWGRKETQLACCVTEPVTWSALGTPAETGRRRPPDRAEPVSQTSAFRVPSDRTGAPEGMYRTCKATSNWQPATGNQAPPRGAMWWRIIRTLSRQCFYVATATLCPGLPVFGFASHCETSLDISDSAGSGELVVHHQLLAPLQTDRGPGQVSLPDDCEAREQAGDIST